MSKYAAQEVVHKLTKRKFDTAGDVKYIKKLKNHYNYDSAQENTHFKNNHLIFCTHCLSITTSDIPSSNNKK